MLKQTTPVAKMCHVPAACRRATIVLGVLVVVSPAVSRAELSQSYDLTENLRPLINITYTNWRWSATGMPSTASGGVIALGECGCFLGALATVANFYLGDPDLQIPWFRALGAGWPPSELPSGSPPWNPAYLNQYLMKGRDGTATLNWGYKSIGNCGVKVYPWAMETIANPKFYPEPLPSGANGLDLTWIRQGDDRNAGLSPEGMRIIDERLARGQPTIVRRRNLNEYGVPDIEGSAHAFVIGGWRLSTREYLVFDPARASDVLEAPRGGLGTDGKYEAWLKNITHIITVSPSYGLADGLFSEDAPSPISFAATDPNGRRSGYNPVTGGDDHQSPNAFEWEQSDDEALTEPITSGYSTKGLYVRNPTDGVWRMEVIGTGTGPYSFNIGTVSGGVRTVHRTVAGSIVPGQLIKHEVLYRRGTPAVVTPVNNFTPQAMAGDDQNSTPGQVVSFDGSRSFDVDGNVISWQWSFGDGSGASGPKASHAYQAPGDYTVALSVNDNGGASSVDSMLVRVRDMRPVANISGPYVAFGYSEVKFNATRSFDPRGGTLTGTWDFGDGTPPLVTTSLTPTHRFTLGPAPPGLPYSRDAGSETRLYTVTVVMSNGTENSLPVTTTVTRLPLQVDYRTGQVFADKVGYAPSSGGLVPCVDPGGTYVLRVFDTGPVDKWGWSYPGWNLADGPLPHGRVLIYNPFGTYDQWVWYATTPPDYSLNLTFSVPANAPAGQYSLAQPWAVEDQFVVSGPFYPCPPSSNRPPTGIAGGPYTGGGWVRTLP